MKAWWFEPADGKLAYGDGRTPAVGVMHTADLNSEVKRFHNGMHGCSSVLSALAFAKSTTLWRVELAGEIFQSPGGVLVARHRRYLWKIDVAEVLKKFARMCVLDDINKDSVDPKVIKFLKTGDVDLVIPTMIHTVDCNKRDVSRAFSAALAYTILELGKEEPAYLRSFFNRINYSANINCFYHSNDEKQKKLSKRLTRLVMEEHKN
jgi:hypothetical protein